MAHYIIGLIDVLDDEKYGAYVSSAPDLADFGAEVVAYDVSPQVIEGSMRRKRVGLVRFPSEEKFREWYDSPAYRAARQHRLSGGADVDMILVQGL
jgi:uncharacterized protein (DUF1330 family)